MSETTPEPAAAETEAPEVQPNTEAPEAPATEPSDEVSKWKALARKNEEAAKRNAEKAAEFDKWQESQKSEAEKNANRIAELEKQLAERDAALLRSQIAAERGLEPELAETLKGETAEEMGEHADRLIAAIQRKYAPKSKPAPSDTGAGATGAADSSDPLALAAAVRRR